MQAMPMNDSIEIQEATPMSNEGGFVFLLNILLTSLSSTHQEHIKISRFFLIRKKL